MNLKQETLYERKTNIKFNVIMIKTSVRVFRYIALSNYMSLVIMHASLNSLSRHSFVVFQVFIIRHGWLTTTDV